MNIQIIAIDLNDQDKSEADKAVGLFNGAQDEYKISWTKTTIKASKPVNWKDLQSQINQKHSGNVIAITSAQFDDNWFSHTNIPITAISVSDWRELYSPPGAHCYLLLEFALAAYLQSGTSLGDKDGIDHWEATGCLLDLNANKKDVRWKLRCGFICSAHQMHFYQHGGNEKQIVALRKILDQVRHTSIGELPSVLSGAETTRCDVLIVCAMEEEFEPIEAAAGGAEKWSECNEIMQGYRDVHDYRLTKIRTNENSTITVVAAIQKRKGLTDAAILTSQAIGILKPKFVVMPGIAAGLKTENREIGDILIPSPAFDYMTGKWRSSNQFESRAREVPLHAEVQPTINRTKRKEIMRTIYDAYPGDKPNREPKVILGPIGSADQVVDNKAVTEHLVKIRPDAVGLEMETYAFYRACQESYIDPPPKFMACKAICDWAIGKNDAGHKYAAFVSARYVLEVIKSFTYK